MSNEECGLCKFYQPQLRGEDILDYGKCHRYPPTVIGDADDLLGHIRPVVACNDWCGEFKAEAEEIEE